MVLLLPGLGDSIYSFIPWIKELKARDLEYKYVEVEVTGKTGFGFRCDALVEAIIRNGPHPMTIIGQSAGALAAMIVASHFTLAVKGVVAVSPAMPRGISPLGLPLISVMWRYQWRMMRNKLISVREQDYRKIALNCVPENLVEDLLFNRRKISGKEALQLSTRWLQPKLVDIQVPTVLVYGMHDQWVAPSAHRKLVQLFASNPKLKPRVVSDAGHLPAHSTGGQRLVREVLDHIL
ncbi:MAG: alpha/beta fold hydrolase [Candidatus Zambryskibacteria bacterium]|nr:alpha/beta fold hydrolase [Candidatus Zambryskibacteria bacterium]